VYYSHGLASVLLITTDEAIISEFATTTVDSPTAWEIWKLQNFHIDKVDYHVNPADPSLNFASQGLKIDEYSSLRLADRVLLDEFNISVRLYLLKAAIHMPDEVSKIRLLIREVNSLISELRYLDKPEGDKPSGLSEYTTEDLAEPMLNLRIRHQSLDRIIEVSSSLSYVTTQSFSGAIPILERRSIIRRNSLLGIGSAILSMNRIARFIESCFFELPLEQIFKNVVPNAGKLEGLDSFIAYESSSWTAGSLDKMAGTLTDDDGFFKMPFFSSRLGYRETEYSISADLQSLVSGASLEWSLLTITHEMLHGHVRSILDLIFFGDKSTSSDENRELFFNRFIEKVEYIQVKNETLFDSLRFAILGYCCRTISHGSLTRKVKVNPAYEFKLLAPKSANLMWNHFEEEYRNVSEVMVHVLDLHYFYYGNAPLYIPLIWSSWASVSHINGNIRQYILRSLLAIASNYKMGSTERFDLSVREFKKLLSLHKDSSLNNPIVHEVLRKLEVKDYLYSSLFPAFSASLILVDMVMGIFLSEKVRSHLMNDNNIQISSNEKSETPLAKEFSYNLLTGFNDEAVKSPTGLLLDRMAKLLDDSSTENVESSTASLFLTLASE